jgi:hypothetical protein
VESLQTSMMNKLKQWFASWNTPELFKKNTAVYIGAGHDVIPFVCLAHIQHFVCIDSAPSHPMGVVNFETYDSPSRYAWILMLISKMEAIGYVHQPRGFKNVPCICFYNASTKQSVHYFIDVIFPYMVHPTLAKELKKAETLILSGHLPHNSIVDYFPLTFEVVGKTGTYYPISVSSEAEDDAAGVLHQVQLYSEQITKRVRKWWYIRHIPEYYQPVLSTNHYACLLEVGSYRELRKIADGDLKSFGRAYAASKL